MLNTQSLVPPSPLLPLLLGVPFDRNTTKISTWKDTEFNVYDNNTTCEGIRMPTLCRKERVREEAQQKEKEKDVDEKDTDSERSQMKITT